MDTKTRILETALKLFLRHGYDKTSMRMLAEELGVTKPAIYHYFDGKEALALEVVEMFRRRSGEWAQQQTRNLDHFDGYLRYFILSTPTFSRIERVLLPDVDELFPYSFNDFVSALACHNEAVRQRMAENFAMLRSKLTGLIERGQSHDEVRGDVDAETLANMIHAMSEGLAALCHYDPAIDDRKWTEMMYTNMKKMLQPQEGR